MHIAVPHKQLSMLVFSQYPVFFNQLDTLIVTEKSMQKCVHLCQIFPPTIYMYICSNLNMGEYDTIKFSAQNLQSQPGKLEGNYQAWTLALFPARMMEISSPRLNAWLKRRRDWKVEINGNHDSTAIGAKMIIPIPASYILANSRTESHKPRLLTTLFHVIANCVSRIRNGLQDVKNQHSKQIQLEI